MGWTQWICWLMAMLKEVVMAVRSLAVLLMEVAEVVLTAAAEVAAAEVEVEVEVVDLALQPLRLRLLIHLLRRLLILRLILQLPPPLAMVIQRVPVL
jgi:hypothetical protein